MLCLLVQVKRKGKFNVVRDVLESLCKQRPDMLGLLDKGNGQLKTKYGQANSAASKLAPNSCVVLGGSYSSPEAAFMAEAPFVPWHIASEGSEMVEDNGEQADTAVDAEAGAAGPVAVAVPPPPPVLSGPRAKHARRFATDPELLQAEMFATLARRVSEVEAKCNANAQATSELQMQFQQQQQQQQQNHNAIMYAFGDLKQHLIHGGSRVFMAPPMQQQLAIQSTMVSCS